MASSISGSVPNSEHAVHDPEKAEKLAVGPSTVTDVDVIEGESQVLSNPTLDKIWKFLSASGVELRGVQPVPEELRTDSAFNKIFTVWCTSLLCPLP